MTTAVVAPYSELYQQNRPLNQRQSRSKSCPPKIASKAGILPRKAVSALCMPSASPILEPLSIHSPSCEGMLPVFGAPTTLLEILRLSNNFLPLPIGKSDLELGTTIIKPIPLVPPVSIVRAEPIILRPVAVPSLVASQLISRLGSPLAFLPTMVDLPAQSRFPTPVQTPPRSDSRNSVTSTDSQISRFSSFESFFEKKKKKGPEFYVGTPNEVVRQRKRDLADHILQLKAPIVPANQKKVSKKSGLKTAQVF
ncbi:MAG: hypothetical protein WC860_05815 [Candidatus Margulisiibacteriota bacterium]|jgi:hypothetical protein